MRLDHVFVHEETDILQKFTLNLGGEPPDSNQQTNKTSELLFVRSVYF